MSEEKKTYVFSDNFFAYSETPEYRQLVLKNQPLQNIEIDFEVYETDEEGIGLDEFHLNLYNILLDNKKFYPSFKESTFNNKVLIENIEGSVAFRDCDFKSSLLIQGKNTNVAFYNCRFYNEVKVENNVRNLRFESCKFYNKSFNITRTEVLGKFRMKRCHLEKRPKFFNSTFTDLADFLNSEFMTYVSFYRTDFLGNLVLSGVKFHNNVLFTYSTIDKAVFFRGTVFKRGLDLSLAASSGSLGLFDMVLGDFFSEKVEPQSKEYEKKLKAGIIPERNKRETFRLIKNRFEELGDLPRSLEYKRLENETYRQMIKGKSERKSDKFILWSNRYSNNYGTDFRNALWILVIGIIPFYISAVSSEKFEICSELSLDTFLEGIKYYAQFLIPTHKFDYMGKENHWLFYITDFVGRVFIGYGIYQFIQAFRKYR